jgi:predicted RNase H-like HicB family nuclease
MRRENGKARIYGETPVNAVASLKGTLVLPAVFTREGDWIVGHLPTLDVSSQGRTQEEAERNLVEAAQLFIESCFARNVFDEVLKNCGFVPKRQVSDRLRLSSDDSPHLTVPFELLAAAHNGSSTIPC